MTLYQKQYVAFQFERAGLFKLLRQEFQCTEVLYPGSSVHITPSFYFPHVVYVDYSETAVKFFANETAVLTHINHHKTYKRSAYVRFIAQDYTKALPLPEGQFDLLLALFAPNVVQTCHKYLRRGGILVTHNLENAVQTAVANPALLLKAVVQYRQKTYQLVTENPAQCLSSVKNSQTKQYLKQTSTGLEYIEAENYFLFEVKAGKFLE